MTEEQEIAARRYDTARREVQKSLTTTAGGKRAESAYGEAYQGLVSTGLAPQIKSKYRP